MRVTFIKSFHTGIEVELQENERIVMNFPRESFDSWTWPSIKEEVDNMIKTIRQGGK